MYRHIVVPLDGSKMAETVLPLVQALTRSCEAADVTFVRVIEPPETVVGDYALLESKVAQLVADEKAEAEKYLSDFSKQADLGGVHVTTKVLEGPAAGSIAKFASDAGADVILIATHGRSGVKHMLWGSVAEEVLRDACVPVMMVRAPGCAAGF